MSEQLTKNQAAFQALLNDFTRSCLAEMCGISRAAVGKWETVPAARVAVLSEKTGWAREALRPDPYAAD